MTEDPDEARHYWPIQYGVFNENGYTTQQELLGDIQLIIEDALNEQVGIEANEYANYAALLVIPDLFEKTYIYEMNRMLFTMGFSKVAVLQVFLPIRPHPPSRILLSSSYCTFCGICFGGN